MCAHVCTCACEYVCVECLLCGYPCLFVCVCQCLHASVSVRASSICEHPFFFVCVWARPRDSLCCHECRHAGVLCTAGWISRKGAHHRPLSHVCSFTFVAHEEHVVWDMRTNLCVVHVSQNTLALGSQRCHICATFLCPVLPINMRCPLPEALMALSTFIYIPCIPGV